MEHFELLIFNGSTLNNDITESLNILVVWIFISSFTLGNTHKFFNINISLLILKFRIEDILEDFFITLEWVNLLVKWIKLIRTIFLGSEFLKCLNSQIVDRGIDFLLRSLIRGRSFHFSFLYGEDMIISVESTQFVELCNRHLIIGISWKNWNV